MSDAEASAPLPAQPFAARIRPIATDEPFRWLAAGWNDFRRASVVSLSYGLVFVAIGLALTGALFAADMVYLFLPLATGFMLIGPALTIGFYAISRDLADGRAPGLGRAIAAFRANPGPLFSLGLVLLILFVLWMRFSALAFALAFPLRVGADLQSLMNAMLFTGGGQTFAIVTALLGAGFAALVFAGGAFALPMLLDRPTGIVEAIATSWLAVTTNLRAMAVWAAILVLLTAAGMAAGMIGLAVTLPLAGHATWHAYKAAIRLPPPLVAPPGP